MDSNDHEPSYYEVALTNRQVVIGFVALLACVFTAFLAGVWLGRDAAPEAAEQVAEAAPSTVEGKRGKKMPKLTFFSEAGTAEAAEESRRGGRKRNADAGRGGGAPDDGGAKPAPGARPADDPSPAASAAERPGAGGEAETLLQTLEAEMAANRQEAPAPVAPPASGAPADSSAAEVPLVPGARVQRSVPPAGAAPAPAPAAKSPAPAPAAKAAAAPATAPFWIQVYSSSNGVRAREIAAQLTRSGFGVRVLEAGTTFRVRVGPYASRDLADASASRLRREQKLDTWVTDQP